MHLLHSIHKATHHSLFPVSRQRACERHLRHLSAMEPEKKKDAMQGKHTNHVLLFMHVCIIRSCQQANKVLKVYMTSARLLK